MAKTMVVMAAINKLGKVVVGIFLANIELKVYFLKVVSLRFQYFLLRNAPINR